MKKANFSNYGNYSSDNYGVNSLCFETEQGVFYFSYTTLVAFRAYTEQAGDDHRGRLYVRQNEWGTTTGKHLNWIDQGNKKSRLTEEDFNKIYDICFS